MTVTDATRDTVESALEMSRVESHLHPQGSFEVADHPVPTGREEIWRFTPLKRLRGLHADAEFLPSATACTWNTPEGVRVEGVDGDEARALRAVRAHLHARREARDLGEAGARHDLHEALVARAVALLRGDGDVELVPGRLAGEGLLEPRDDVALAVEVAERPAAARGIDDGALLVPQGVFERHDAVLFDLHGGPPDASREAGAEW